MKFSDIVTLAKAGYSPSDVKNLLELCETDPKTKNTVVEQVDTQNNNEEETAVEMFAKIVKESEG